MPRSSTSCWPAPRRRRTKPPPPPRKGKSRPGPHLIVAGRGRLGRSLAPAFVTAGRRVELVSGHAAPAALRALLARTPGAACVFLAVPDPAVQPLAESIAAEALPSELAIAHVSGALGLDVLQPLEAAGHPVGSFHPLQSFPVERPPTAFRRSLVAVDARPPEFLSQLQELAVAIGGVPRHVPDAERTLYHAAAVLGSNYLVVLAAQAASVLQAAGWDRKAALEALLPLMAGVLENLQQTGLPEALIGPIRRGDPQTVERHLQALGEAAAKTGPVPEGVYRILGIGAVELALEAGLDQETARRINTALTAGAAATGR